MDDHSFYQLCSRLVTSSRFNRDDVLNLLSYANDSREKIIELQSKIFDCQTEITRLNQENEFLLRLINDRDRSS